jgi:hypothetical protein
MTAFSHSLQLLMQHIQMMITWREKLCDETKTMHFTALILLWSKAVSL